MLYSYTESNGLTFGSDRTLLISVMSSQAHELHQALINIDF